MQLVLQPLQWLPCTPVAGPAVQRQGRAHVLLVPFAGWPVRVDIRPQARHQIQRLGSAV